MKEKAHNIMRVTYYPSTDSLKKIAGLCGQKGLKQTVVIDYLVNKGFDSLTTEEKETALRAFEKNITNQNVVEKSKKKIKKYFTLFR